MSTYDMSCIQNRKVQVCNPTAIEPSVINVNNNKKQGRQM